MNKSHPLSPDLLEKLGLPPDTELKPIAHFGPKPCDRCGRYWNLLESKACPCTPVVQVACCQP